MRRFIGTSLAVVIALATPAGTTAQEATDGEADEPQLEQQEEIVVQDTLPYLPDSNTIATKLPLPLDQTPASVGVVTAPILQEQRAIVLGQALQNVSGLNTQTGNGVFDFFIVRGQDSVTSSTILVDGAREPESSFYQMYNVDRVEVLKGPSSFLYGGGPLAGAVNLVRKQPLPGDFTTVAVTGGSYSTLEGLVDWNTANDDGSLSFRLNTIYRESDGYRDDKANELFAINPALTWRPSDRTRVNFTYELLDSEYKSDAGLPLINGTELPDVPRRRSYQSPFDISDQEINRAQVDIEHKVGADSMFRTKLYYRSLEWLSKGTLFNGVFPSATGSLDVSRFLAELDDDQTFVGGEFEYLLAASTGSVTHNLLFGLELSRLEDEFTFVPSLLPNIDLFDPVETAQEPLFPIPGQSMAADAETTIVAPYFIDQISFSDRWQMLLGARWDTFDFDEKVLGTRLDEDHLSPMLGLIFAASDAVSIYGNVGSGFAPPSTFALEPDRVSEESDQYELGVKASLAPSVDATFAFYQIDRENIAIPDNTGVTQQTGDQRSRGFELEVSAELAPRTRLIGAYAYTDAELTEFTEQVLIGFFPPMFATIDRSGNTPAFTPDHILNLWFSRQLDSGFGYGLGTRYVSEQFIAEDNTFEIDDYWTFDATLSYQLQAWRVSLFLKNLTGEEYLTRGFGNASVIPAAESSGYLTLEYTF